MRRPQAPNAAAKESQKGYRAPRHVTTEEERLAVARGTPRQFILDLLVLGQWM